MSSVAEARDLTYALHAIEPTEARTRGRVDGSTARRTGGRSYAKDEYSPPATPPSRLIIISIYPIAPASHGRSEASTARQPAPASYGRSKAAVTAGAGS